MTNQTLKLGPGLRQDGDAIFVMKAGRLRFSKPNNCWVKSSEKRGKISMVDAEKRLLANALQDTDNQHFILLSDSCVPLHNFDYVYNYLMDTNVGFIDSFEDPGPHGTGRYLDNMLLEIEKKDWRKGAQEMVLHRPCLWNGVKRPCYLFARTRKHLKIRYNCHFYSLASILHQRPLVDPVLKCKTTAALMLIQC